MGRYLFRLPDIGEGVTEAEVAAWHVAPGDRVEEDQSLVDVMTDKATVDMSSPVTGVVMSVNEALTADPSPINADPYGDGWIFTVEVTDAGGELLDAAAYSALIA